MSRAARLALALLFVFTVTGFGFDWFHFGKLVVPNSKYLVVLEHNWEHNLSEPEYSEGSMFKAFFAKDPKIQVRHRFFTDTASLRKWLSEIAEIKGDVYLVFADHGSPEGLHAEEDDIGYKAIADSLDGAKNLKLIHFSACSVMRSGFPAKLIYRMGPTAPPVSGYMTDVDWTISQITDFLFLDLVLNDNRTPLAAAFELKQMMPIAGDRPVTPNYKSLGFIVVQPEWIWKPLLERTFGGLFPNLGETNAVQVESPESLPGTEQAGSGEEVCSGDAEGQAAAEAR